MLKRLLKSFCFSLLLIMMACAPKPTLKAPPLHEYVQSLDDILSIVGRDIDVLKAITDVTVKKNKELYDRVNASVLVKKPGWIHMRMYKFGILVKDVVIRNDTMYIHSGKQNFQLKQLARELYNAVFWWGDLEDGKMSVEEKEYIIRKGNKEIYLDKDTLLPLKQNIHIMDTDILLTYESPKEQNGFWYPSVINIYVRDFQFVVELKKMIRNPSLSDLDFRTHSKEVNF